MKIILELTERELDIVNYAMLEYLYQIRKLRKETHLDFTKKELESVLAKIEEMQRK